MAEASTTQLQAWMEGMNAGDAAARNALLAHTCDRLRDLTHRMLRDFQRVQRWEDTDDVLQNALVRLLRALEAEKPSTVAAYFRLATLQIRRELLDLARHYFGPEGLGDNHATNARENGADSPPPPPYEKAESTNDPGRLAMWAEFHEKVQALPAEERDVFDLLWYQGLQQADAATVLSVSVPTVKRRWLKARRLLGAVLQDQ